MRLLALILGAAALAAAKEEDYLSAKLAPPWVDTTDSPVIDLKPPPQPPNPPPPPKDGAVWGTFYPAAPPPPPPPPPPLPFPLAAAAGGGKSSGTDSTGATGAPGSFLQVLESGVRAGRLGRDDSALAQLHASLLAVAAAAAPNGPLSAASGSWGGGRAALAAVGQEVAAAAAQEARGAASRAVRAGLAERPLTSRSPLTAGRVSLASLLQSSASARLSGLERAKREAERRATEALTTMGAAHAARSVLTQAMAIPRFASASLSAYASRRRAAADLLRSAARAAERSAAAALKGADLPAPASAAAAGMADSPVDDAARSAGLVASGALRAAGDRQRFRQRARAQAGSTRAAAEQFGPHFGINYGSNPYQFPYNPFAFVGAQHSYGPSNLGTHPFGGPLYANFGYFPPSSSILKGVVTPQGDPNPDKLGKAQSGSLAAKADADDNGNPKTKDGKPVDPPSGAYNPSAPPFFLQGTGWPYPYFMNPNVAPPAHFNPTSSQHYGPRYNDVPVLHGW